MILLPHPSPTNSAQVLDTKLLISQIKYRPRAFLDYQNSAMWKYHTHFLCECIFAQLEELTQRGKYYANIFDKYHEIQLRVTDTGTPEWWGDPQVHDSHKAYLLRKDWTYYQQFGWKVDRGMPLFHPKVDLKERLRNLQPALRLL